MRLATAAIVIQGTCCHCGRVWAAPVPEDGRSVPCPYCQQVDERPWAAEWAWCPACARRWLAVCPEAEAQLHCPSCGLAHPRTPGASSGPMRVLAA
ncbi:MAG: hypothetical protein HGA45_42965 [Chloroflexales bacterium]|nr:hypothetical protein [Chloroflexales bacterium]